jgi:hypothetical protein
VIAEIEELEEAAEEVRKILVKEEEPIYCLLQDNSQARHLSSIILPRTQPQAITGMQPITITLDPHVLTLFLLGQDLRLGLLLDSTSRAPSGAIPVPNSTYFHSPLPLLIAKLPSPKQQNLQAVARQARTEAHKPTAPPLPASTVTTEGDPLIPLLPFNS